MQVSGGDVVVVGAGLIGLAIAFELAERGASVRVYDRAEPGRGASWAGAGMLAPHSERLEDEAMLGIGASSLAQYPGFVERVRAASGMDSRLHLDGIVHTAFDSDRLEDLRGIERALHARGVACDLLDRRLVLAAEPALSPGVLGGLVVHGEGWVDNRRLGRALTAACQARGVRMARSAEIAVECDSRRALGVRTSLGFVAASAVVNACGAWAAALEGVPPLCRPPVEPVKGQMLAIGAPDAFLRRTTWVPGAYLVPRGDGRLLVGATMERTGFDERVTAAGVHGLLAAALAAAPSLGSFTVTESWAGLRPGTPDGRPFIGPTALEGFFLATGHFRNGILLAPATARLVADAIEKGARHGLEAFGLARFGTEEAAAARMARS